MKNIKTYVVAGFDLTFDRYNSACSFAREQGLDRSAVSKVTNNPVVNQEEDNMNIQNANEAADTIIATEDIVLVEVIDIPEVKAEDVTEPTDPVIETETPTDVIAEVPEAAKTPAPTFRLVLAKKVRAGFETVLMTELAKGPGTTVELVDRMLASGEFIRVAPMAATKRPFKPTNFLLRQWLNEGLVTTAPLPVAELPEGYVDELSTELVAQ